MTETPVSCSNANTSLRPERGILLLAFAVVALHLATAGRYGIFRDELYYLACAKHLAWGYVDQPPLIALLTWLTTHLFGSSLLAIRFLPALASGLLVLLTATIARELGGGRFAQYFAAFAVIPVPIYLILHHWLTMNAFEPLFWMAVVWCALRSINTNEPRYWLIAGVLCGIGLENKYSMLFCIAGLIVGLVLTQERRWLRNRWFWAGVILALTLFLPNFLWLIHHNFPFLEFERDSRMSGSRIARAPIAFIADQALIMNPLLFPLWIAGLVWLFTSVRSKKYRLLGWMFLTIFLTLLLMKAKNYYVAPAYPMLFAAGAVAIEQATAHKRHWFRFAYIAAILLSGCVLAPLVMPILPVQSFLRYQKHLGGFTPVQFENLKPSPLPQYFADEFGWENMARQTAKVYNRLPPADRADTAIFANNFGEAGAIDFFGPKYGLPPSISNHESYWLWGPRNYTGKSVIVLGSDGVGDREHFRSVEVAGRVDDPYCRPIERFDLFLCHGLTTELHAFWPKTKNW